MKRIGLGRELALILGSFLIVAIVLISYFHAPLLPILVGGLLAIIITIVSHLFAS